MSSKYEKTQLTKILISSLPATIETAATATFLDLSCTLKEIQFTAGQKQDMDVTSFCSEEQENDNGLPAPSEISMSGNFYRSPAQDALRDAYDNDTRYAFKVIFPSGVGFMFIAEVRQHTWSAGVNSSVAATFSLRLKGKPQNIGSDLRLTTDLAATKAVTAGTALTLSVVASGGTAPYSYVWKKAGSTVSGQTTATFNKTGSAAADAGSYTCEISDSSNPIKKITSTACAVTIN